MSKLKSVTIDGTEYTAKRLAAYTGVSLCMARHRIADYEKGKKTVEQLLAPVNKMKSANGSLKRKSKKKHRCVCYVGDKVWHDGKQILVQQVLENGSAKKFVKAYIKGCSLDDNGKPLHRTNVFAGRRWTHEQIR